MVSNGMQPSKPATRMVARPVPFAVGRTRFIMRRFGNWIIMVVGVIVSPRMVVGRWSLLIPMDPADRRAPHLVAKGIPRQLIANCGDDDDDQ